MITSSASRQKLIAADDLEKKLQAIEGLAIIDSSRNCRLVTYDGTAESLYQQLGYGPKELIIEENKVIIDAPKPYRPVVK